MRMLGRVGLVVSLLSWLVASSLACGDDATSGAAAPAPRATGSQGPGDQRAPDVAPGPSGVRDESPASSGSPSSTDPIADTRSLEERVAAGRAVYNANCIACHGMDPTRDGALGPAVSGSSLELLEARVLRGEYPDGYEPKRPSRVMVALPHLENELPALEAYLNSL